MRGSPQQPQNPNPPPFTPPPTTNVFIWPTGNGTWPTGPKWLAGTAPANASDVAVIESGKVSYNLDLAIFSLAIDGPGSDGAPRGELDITGGGLSLTELDVAGLLLVKGDPSVLVTFGPVLVESGGKIVAGHNGAVIDFFSANPSNPATVDNFGTIAAKHGGNVAFFQVLVTNEAANAGNTNPDIKTPAGRIVSIGCGSLVNFTEVDLDNAGIVAAKRFGEIAFVESSVTNEASGHIKTKYDGVITFAGTDVTNYGAILAEHAGKITFDSLSQVTNETGGRIESSGCESCIAFSGNELDNSGVVGAACYGVVRFFGETIVNEASSTDPTVPGGKIEAKDGGRIEILGGSVSNGSGAVFAATDHGSILFASTASNLLGVTNEDGGKITASDCGIITFKNVGLFNDTGATITAKDHGIVAFFETKNSTAGIMNGGTIRAEDHGVVAFVDVGVGESGGVMNAGGLIEAIGCGARVDLADSTIVGGTLQTRDGGVIDAVHGRSTFLNVFINGGIIAVDCHASLALLGDTIIDKTVTFEGPGVFLLKGSDSITGNGSSHALLKNDSTIAGSGTIGGNGLTLINECCGTILAIGGSGDPLIIDTGSHKITNDGLLEASWCGVLDIKSKLDNYGRVIATDGGEVVADANVVNKHGALIEAEHGGTVTLDGIKIENDFCAVIEAKGDCATVFIDCSTVDNAGTIEAKYGGTVSIADATIHNECGLIAAFGRGALVELTNSIIYGGTLATGDPCSPCFGAIEITGGANTVVFDGSGQKVTVDGFVQVDPGATLELIGTIDNKGTIDVDGESSADLQIDGTVKLDGRGDVVLDGRNDEITGAPTDDSHSAKLENSNEISGFGKIGSDSDGNLKLDNKADGVVNADMRHEKLVIETGNTVSNAGLLEASHGGILVIKDDVNNKGGAVDAHWFSTVVVGGITIDNTDGGANDGSVEAHGCGATVVLYDGTDIIGGALSTSDGGLIEIANQPGHTHSDVTFDGAERAADGSILPLIIDGVVRVDENTALTLKGTIKNDGIIDVDSEGHSSAGADLRIDGTVKLEGSGDVVLEGRNDEITGVPAGESRSAKLENSSEISGYGKIGSDGNGLLTLDNKADGVVDADMRHEKLVVDTGNTVTNEGLLEASCGGVLDIKDDVDNKGGIIGAYGAGSLVKLFGITVTGGTLETGDPYWRDDGLIEVMATCAMTVFDGSQQHDPVTIAGFVQVDPGAQLELKGTIDLDGGAIELDQATRHETVNGANLVIDGTVTLDGFGDVALEGNGTGIVGAWCGGGTLINDSYIYGSRGGFIGTGDDALTFINNNIVDSEAGHAGPLVIDTGCNIVTNTGTLEATGASELDLYGTYANQNGTIAASEDGSGPSVVKLFGATIEGGTLVTDGGSVAADGSAIEIVAGYGISVFDGSDQKVTVDAYVNVDSGAQLELIGTIQDLGIINVDEAASGADLVIDGMVKLNGGGEILLSGSDDSIIGVCGDEDTSNMLVNSDTIAGYGKIGNAGSDESTDLTLTNKGMIDADVSGQTLTIHTGHIVDNQGTLEASSGGILQIDDVVQNSGSGSALIAGGILGFAAKADVDVTFETSAYGVLMLSDAAQFTGKIFGFSGTAANTGSSDAVDLVGFDEADTSFTSHVHNGITTVTVADSSGDDLSAVLNFSGTGFTFQLGASGDGTYLFDPPSAGLSANATAEGTLSFANNDAASDLNASVTPEGSGYAGNLTLDSVGDSNGTASVDYGFSLGNDQINVAAGQTVTQSYEVNLTDAQNPTANASQAVAVSIGGAGNDNFVFAPGVGADTIVNFNPQHDTIELDHFANAQTVQELQSLITSDAHGDAFINLGNHDSVTVEGLTAAQLQANLQNLIHLH